MTADDRPEDSGQRIEEEPVTEVPEADAVEQRTGAGTGEEGSWLEDAVGEYFEGADEADVVEQLREAGSDDDDEWR